MQPITLQDGTQLDPKVLKVLRTIRQLESNGDYNAVGDGGDARGAYQFNEKTGIGWKNYAKTYLGDENAPMTPGNQNKAMYGWVLEKKNKGLQPEEIDALHNGAKKDASGRYVHLSSDRANKFRQAIIGGQTTEASTGEAETQPEKVRGGFLGELFTGSTQRFGKTIGESLAAGKNTELYTQALEQNTEIANNLRTKIAENRKIGKDTSRLENALDQLIKDTPKQEDFTGDVINKTTGQVLGEAGGTALEALSGGLLGRGTSAVASKTLSTFGKIKEGAKIGAIYGGIGGATSAMQEGEGLSGTLKGAGTGAAIGGVLGGGLGAVGSVFGRKSASVDKTRKAAGEILQGETKDVNRGLKILSGIDTEGVKTYDDLTRKLANKEKSLVSKQDKLLSKDTRQIKLNKLNTTLKAGDKNIKHNFVEDALKQLEDFYKKINDQIGKFEIQQLRKKANTQGLTIKEINDLARTHGGRLNAYNASGELASGLTKQAAENTRAGLKTTVRDLFGNPASKRIDLEITDTIRVRDLTQKMAEKVNQLQQRIQERSIGAKAGYYIGKFINTLGLGSPKGIVEALIPRGQGFKVMNALDLERALQKNLKLLQEITEKNLPEETIIQKIDAFLNAKPTAFSPSVSKKPSTFNLEDKSTRNKISKNIPPTKKSSGIPMNLVDSTGKDSVRKVMENLEKNHSKQNVIKIIEELFEKNPTGRFTPREIADIASKYKLKVPYPGAFSPRK